MELNLFSLIGYRLSFAGLMIGGIYETQEMLNSCAEHNFIPKIEIIITAAQIDESYKGVIRFRCEISK